MNQQLAIIDELEEIEGASALNQLKDPQSSYSVAVSQLIDGLQKLREMIDRHPLSKEAELRFLNSMATLLEHQRLSRGRISIMFNRGPFPRGDVDWFGSDYRWDGRLLDNMACVTILHPRLFVIAKERWSDDPRVDFSTIPREDGGSYDDERVALLQRHGVPADTSTWMWAYEALHFAEEGLNQLGIELRLCDFVEWTCTAEPPNMWAGAIRGEPKLYAETPFGHRLRDDPVLTRLDGCEIWKTVQGTYVSPLWEYLSWSGDTYGEHSVYASSLGDIGKGIDRALAIHDQDFDPASDSRIRLTATDIFRAGEALTKLRIKLELGEVVDKGVKAETVAKDRAKRGGVKSAEARAKRMAALLSRMEQVVRENPIVTGLGPERVADLSIDACIDADPSLWAQGRGMVGEYVGEIRRGEAGADMRDRLLTMFPRPTLKRSS